MTTDSKVGPILFVKFQMALYGMLKSTLLIYKKLLTDLVTNEFKINGYDPCIVTKKIRGKQMRISWHVDNLKNSHEDPKKVSKVK
jgi:hypothetical protein